MQLNNGLFPGKLGVFKQVTMLETRIILEIKPCYLEIVSLNYWR